MDTFRESDNLRFILDLGGIIGNSLLVFVEGNEFLSRLVDLKSLSLVLAGYLMLNVSVVGLALIFEMIRNLFLGGQVIGGIGGSCSRSASRNKGRKHCSIKNNRFRISWIRWILCIVTNYASLQRVG